MHGVNRTAEILGPAGFHLNKHQYRSVLGDQIQFSQRRAEIPGDDPIPLPPQIAFCRRFSLLPKEPSRITDCHAIVRFDFRYR